MAAPAFFYLRYLIVDASQDPRIRPGRHPHLRHGGLADRTRRPPGFLAIRHRLARLS
ncbi:hypothetical protein MASSI9I_40223 [Massilia sp. 9I]|nr:hypothetical protein MASSI9I_40223 [Massilia sp. 9I]